MQVGFAPETRQRALEKIGLCISQGFRLGWLEPLHCGAGYNMGSPGQGQDELSPANLIRAY